MVRSGSASWAPASWRSSTCGPCSACATRSSPASSRPRRERREAFAAQANRDGLGPCTAFAEPGRRCWRATASTRSGSPARTTPASPSCARSMRRRSPAGPPCARSPARSRLARTLAEAREMLRLAEDAGLLHGYLENQLFSTAVQRGRDIVWRRAVPNSGRPYLARADRGAFRPARALVLGRRAAGRRRALRHDVPLASRSLASCSPGRARRAMR